MARQEAQELREENFSMKMENEQLVADNQMMAEEVGGWVRCGARMRRNVYGMSMECSTPCVCE